jgi:hypothetical protein
MTKTIVTPTYTATLPLWAYLAWKFGMVIAEGGLRLGDWAEDHARFERSADEWVIEWRDA